MIPSRGCHEGPTKDRRSRTGRVVARNKIARTGLFHARARSSGSSIASVNSDVSDNRIYQTHQSEKKQEYRVLSSELFVSSEHLGRDGLAPVDPS
jgi:hypothetical protein